MAIEAVTHPGRPPSGGSSRSGAIALLLDGNGFRAAVVAAAIFLSVLGQVSAQTRLGFEALDLVVDQPLLEEIGTYLNLSEEQYVQAQAFHKAYFEAVTRLEEETVQQWRQLDKLRQDIEVGARQRRESPQMASAHIRVDFLALLARASREADGLLENWLADLQSVLTVDQAERFPGVVRLIRRRNLLDLKHDRNWGDFHRPLDLLEVVQQGREGDAEFAEFFGPGQSDGPDDRAARKEAQTVLSFYEYTLDVELQRRVADRRRPLNQLPNAGEAITAQTEEGRRYLHRRGKTWGRLYGPAADAAEQIAALLELYVSPGARRRWEERFWRALAPNLMTDFWIDDAVAWLTGRPDHTAEQLVLAEESYRQHVQQRHELRRAAIRIGAKVIRSHSDELATSPAQLAFAKAVLNLIDQHEQALRRFRGVLIDEQVAEYDRTVRQARVTQLRRFTIWIPDRQLHALGRLETSEPRAKWDSKLNQYIFLYWDPKLKRYAPLREPDIDDPSTQE